MWIYECGLVLGIDECSCFCEWLFGKNTTGTNVRGRATPYTTKR